MNTIPNTQIRQVLLLCFIGVLFLLLFWNLRTFLPAALGAYTLYVIMRTPMQFLTNRWHFPKKLAVALLLLLSFVIILIPLNAVIGILNARLASTIQNSQDLLQNLEQVVRTIEAKLGLTLITTDNVKALTDWGINEVQYILNATLSGLLTILVMYFILWFMLSNGTHMETSFFDWLPLKSDNIPFVRKQLNQLVYSNALGIPLMGVVQGLAGLLGYWLAGVQDLWLWVMLTFIAGMIPIFGVTLAYIPLTLLLLAQGETGKAMFVLPYGIIVIGSVDNLARMWLLQKIGHTHPLVTLFGVIAGLKLFGFIGFIFGPIMIALFLLLVKIYEKEFGRGTSGGHLL